MSRRWPLSLHLRVRASALLLAAARLSRRSARRIRQGGREARIPDRKELRAQLHDLLRASGELYRPLARSADLARDSGRCAWCWCFSGCRAGADPLIRNASASAAAPKNSSSALALETLRNHLEVRVRALEARIYA